MSRDARAARRSPRGCARLALAGVALVAAVGCDSSPCANLDGGPPLRVTTGRYTLQPGAGVWSDVPDPAVPPELNIDRDAGVVIMTRIVDGGRVVARYRIGP